MTDWTSFTLSTDMKVGSPTTFEMMRAMYNNPIAIAEGNPAAPAVRTSALAVAATSARNGAKISALGGDFVVGGFTVDVNRDDFTDPATSPMTTAGVFTCPVAGLYRFAIHGQVTQSGADAITCSIALRKNGTSMVSIGLIGTSGEVKQFSGEIIADMAVGGTFDSYASFTFGSTNTVTVKSFTVNLIGKASP